MLNVRRAPKARGFTLLEIIVALVILGLLVGSVFGILIQAGNTAAEVRELDSRDEQMSRFLGMMRRTIESMPEGGTISMIPPAESATGFYEMTIEDGMTAFAFGENPGTAGETIIGMRPQPDEETSRLIGSESIEAPLYQVAISRSDFMPEDTDGDGMVFNAGADSEFLNTDEEGRYWLPLLNHVTGMSWRFWDETQRDWLEEWADDSRLPLMLELSITDVYRPAAIRLVFDVPDHLTESSGGGNQPATGGSSNTGGGGGSTAPQGDSIRSQNGGDGADRRPGDSSRFRGKGGGDGRGPGGKGFGKGKGPGGKGPPGGGRGPQGGGKGAAPPGNPAGGGNRGSN